MLHLLIHCCDGTDVCFHFERICTAFKLLRLQAHCICTTLPVGCHPPPPTPMRWSWHSGSHGTTPVPRWCQGSEPGSDLGTTHWQRITRRQPLGPMGWHQSEATLPGQGYQCVTSRPRMPGNRVFLRTLHPRIDLDPQVIQKTWYWTLVVLCNLPALCNPPPPGFRVQDTVWPRYNCCMGHTLRVSQIIRHQIQCCGEKSGVWGVEVHSLCGPIANQGNVICNFECGFVRCF